MAQCPSLIGKSWVRILESLTIFGGTNLHFGASECFERPFCAYGWSKNVSLSCEYVQHAYPVSKYLSRCNLKGLATKSSSKSLFLLFFFCLGVVLVQQSSSFPLFVFKWMKDSPKCFLVSKPSLQNNPFEKEGDDLSTSASISKSELESVSCHQNTIAPFVKTRFLSSNY